MLSLQACTDLLFESYLKKGKYLTGYDSEVRNLAGMRTLFERVQLPLDRFPTMIITGSKGKGSTAILCSALLTGIGHRVGLLTSPSYLNLRERMRIDGRAIPEADFRRITTALAPHIRAVDNELPADQYLSPTGLFLAVALRYFSEQGIDALVLEVGRGGRFDDVSLVHNQVAVLTPIMDEHLEQLGPTVRDVAWHKAGIIKRENQVISAEQMPDVETMIRQIAAEKNAAIRWVHPLEDVELMTDTITQRITLDDISLRIPHPARFVPDNLALAWHAVRALQNHLTEKAWRLPAIQAVLDQVKLPGRTQCLQMRPVIWLDGAINERSAQLFRDSVLVHSPLPRTLITAMPADKDYHGLLTVLAPHIDTLIVTRVAAGYLIFDENMLTVAREIGIEVLDIADVQAALNLGVEKATIDGSLWIVGTQSLLREALARWQSDLEILY